jgi:hypothetical protein
MLSQISSLKGHDFDGESRDASKIEVGRVKQQERGMFGEESIRMVMKPVNSSNKARRENLQRSKPNNSSKHNKAALSYRDQ